MLGRLLPSVLLLVASAVVSTAAGTVAGSAGDRGGTGTPRAAEAQTRKGSGSAKGDARSKGPAPSGTTDRAPTQAEPDASTSIAWMDWGPDAFRKAIARERPIVLNVVASWSLQCRQMEATWANPRIVALVNEAFVPVRVDADRRPDVRSRYRVAAWPSVTLLLPNGIPFYGVREDTEKPFRVAFGLLPPERLAPILQEALTVFRDKSRRASLRKTVEEGMKAEEEAKNASGALDPASPGKILESLRANFDALHGGWTKAPKFPMESPIEACLFRYSREHDPRDLEIAERALHAVVDGPLFDRVEGGVHRLAEAEDWSQPEYEKLLDRNVPLLDNLLSAYVLTGKREYADRAEMMIRYLRSTLRRTGGGYYASQAADLSSSDGGDYYRASEADRRKRTSPAVDRLVLVAWSAKAAAAELRAAHLLGRPELAVSGRETLNWLLANGYDRGRGVVHALEQDGRILPAYLEDQIVFSEAMLDSGQLTGDKAYTRVAKDVAVFILANMRDGRTGLFGDIIPNPKDPAVPLQTAFHPFDLNCRLARLLSRLFYLNPADKMLRDGALGVLEAYGGGYGKGPDSALYALAASEYTSGPLWIWVLGKSSVPGYDAMLGAAHGIPELWKMVVSLDPSDPSDGKTIAQLGFRARRPPLGYLSLGTRTSKPATNPAELKQFYREILALGPGGAASDATEDQRESGKKAPPAGGRGSEPADEGNRNPGTRAP